MSDAKPVWRMDFSSIVFKVEDELYRVPRHGFEKWSKSLFPDMLALPQSDAPVEGTSDAHPIVPPDCSKLELESLLAIMYPWCLATKGSELTLTKDEWAAALKLARQWDMPEIATLVIENMNKLALSPTEKVALGRRFRNARWLREGCAEIVKQCDALPLDELGASLGWEVAARLLVVAHKSTLRARAHDGDAVGIDVPLEQTRCSTKSNGAHGPFEYHYNKACISCNLPTTGRTVFLPLSAPCLQGEIAVHARGDPTEEVLEVFVTELSQCIVDNCD